MKISRRGFLGGVSGLAAGLAPGIECRAAGVGDLPTRPPEADHSFARKP